MSAAGPVDPDAAQHLTWCRDVRGLSAGTVRVRTSVLLGLGDVVGRPLREATAADLLRWQAEVSTGNAATRNAYSSHAASFYGWLVDEGLIAESPAVALTRVKIPRPVRGARPRQTRDGAGLLDRWTTAQQAAGNAPRTILERRRVIEAAARHTGQDPAAFTVDALAGWLATLPGQGTRGTYHGALRAWFTWLVDVEELRADNPMRKLKRPREPRRRPRPVATGHIDVLLASGIRGRTKTWVLLAALQGLRVHEIAKIRGEDVDFIAQTLRVVGKGGVDATLPLHPLVAVEAAKYPAAGWWFPSYEAYGRAGEHIVSATVSITISRAMRRAGIPATAHQLRHWFGTNTLRTAGGNLRVAQEALRHASVATTALYTKVDDSELRAAVVSLTLGARAS